MAPRAVAAAAPSTSTRPPSSRCSSTALNSASATSATASDRVFTTDLGAPLQPNAVGQAFRRLVNEAGVPVIRLHDLRHTRASQLLMAGINIEVVSERLGHVSVGFTVDTYAHVMPGQQAEAAAAAAALLEVGER